MCSPEDTPPATEGRGGGELSLGAWQLSDYVGHRVRLVGGDGCLISGGLGVMGDLLGGWDICNLGGEDSGCPPGVNQYMVSRP